MIKIPRTYEVFVFGQVFGRGYKQPACTRLGVGRLWTDYLCSASSSADYKYVTIFKLKSAMLNIIKMEHSYIEKRYINTEWNLNQ